MTSCGGSGTRPSSSWHPAAATAALPGFRATFGVDRKMPLDCGVELGPFTIAWQSYGELNRDRSNAILVCHALTGDQFAAEPHPMTGKPGWWSQMIGPGRPLDTTRYHIICVNVLGGCMGTTGPRGLILDPSQAMDVVEQLGATVRPLDDGGQD